MEERLRAWAPELAAAATVLALGAAEAATAADYSYHHYSMSRSGLLLVALLAAVAVACCRRAPGAALAVAWLLAGVHYAGNYPVLLTEFALAAVLFGAARWGRPVVVAASGMSIPTAVLALLAVIVTDSYPALSRLFEYRTLVDTVGAFGDTFRVGAVIAALALMGAPWLAGLALRSSERARVSRESQTVAEERASLALRETEQAREIARLREEQARLARDVHDVVGHSLAVILAQAESAQYLPDDDPGRLKQTMATIASSARSSLQDVRQVLSSPDAGAAPARPLDTLVDGVRAGGHEVVLRELGTARPLPPDLEVTAYRVLQEMLTNAVRHGRRDEPVFVERHWPDDTLTDDLRLEVRNAAAGPTGGKGRGLDGMQQRLAAVGGRLDVRRREEEAGETFTVTAWLPLGPR